MKIVIQRAHNAHVSVGGKTIGKIDQGLVLLVGVTHDDETTDINYLAQKIVNLRIFEDEDGKMNKSLKDVSGSILSISQFTLYGETKKGRRPNFMKAARPDKAEKLYHEFNETIRKMGVHVETGVFGEMMDVSFTNVGPVTLILDSKD